MGLSNAKEAELKSMPKVEFVARKSKDGKYIIHRTIITDIKPVSYYEKVLTSETENETTQEAQAELPSAKA